MKAKEFIIESKTIKTEKPRNFVAKNAKMGGAGAHKDKKKAVKQGDIKHKKKEIAMSEESGGKVEQLENLVMQLEQLLPSVTKAQKNHYVFEKIQSEIGMIAEAAKELSDRSLVVEITDTVESAIEQLRQSNSAIYNIEKTLKDLIKHTGYELDDAREEKAYESRFGNQTDNLKENLEEFNRSNNWGLSEEDAQYLIDYIESGEPLSDLLNKFEGLNDFLDDHSMYQGPEYWDAVRTSLENIEEGELSIDTTDESKYNEDFDIVTEIRTYASDKNYSQAPDYKQYNIFISKSKFNPTTGYIAIAERPRDKEVVFRANGNKPDVALAALRNKIDTAADEAPKVSGAATIDFNVFFLKDILEDSLETFYAKIIAGPKLVIASDEYYNMPGLLRDEGFKPSTLRKQHVEGQALPLPGIPLSPSDARSANLVANGRYLLGTENQDRDGHKVFDLEFDSVVQHKNERQSLKAPGLTVGSLRAK